MEDLNNHKLCSVIMMAIEVLDVHYCFQWRFHSSSFKIPKKNS